MRKLQETDSDAGDVRPADGTEKRGVEVTFGESAEGGIRCVECAAGGDRG